MTYLRKRFRVFGLTAVTAIASMVIFAGVPSAAQPVATTSANIFKRLFGLAKTANKRSVIANKRSLNAITLARRPGPEGPRGPEGPQGPQGSPGVLGVETVEAPVVMGPEEFGEVKASCPAGTTVLGTGFGSEGFPADPLEVWIEDNAVIGFFHNFSGTESSEGWVQAICAKVG